METATRPIAPGTKHPMSRLLHLAGRAWFFMVKHYKGEHFAIQTSQEVPRAIQDMHKELCERLNPGDQVEATVKDIRGCYPNMPKTAIKMALKQIVEDLRKEKYNGVFVPRRGRQQPCQWKVKGAVCRSTWKYVQYGYRSKVCWR